MKAGDEWQRRQAGKQASYGRWSLMRDASSQQRWRQQAEAEQQQQHTHSDQQQEDSRGGAHYWRWYDDGQQQQRGPQFAWQRSQSQSVPAAVVQAGETLGLPPLSHPASPAAAAPSMRSVWSVADIKAAFKRRALLTHPDMPNGDQKAFQATAKAYDTLISYIYQTRQ